MSTSMDIECPDCGDVNSIEVGSIDELTKSFWLSLECEACGSPLFDEEDYIEKPPAFVFTPSSKASSPGYQEPDRYQPEGGKWRIGRDVQTGQYVDAPQAGRKEGLYIIGTSGTGKTGLIENLIIQDIKQDRGVGLLDPHGDLTHAVLSRLPSGREKDVIYLNITDYHYPFGVNPFECSDLNDYEKVQKTIDKVFHIFEKILGVTQETQLILEYLYNCTATLIANPGYTMADIPMLLQDGECRKKLVANVTDIDVQRFWRLHEQKKPADQNTDIASILRRVRRFLQPLSRNIIGQSKSTIDLQKIMDEGKILLIQLDAELDDTTKLIGSTFIALFLNAAYARPENKRRQFNLYADEFQRFATEDFATLLVEARKFGVATTIAHQARYQPGMTDGIRATSLSAKNLIVFKVNSKDADELAGEFDITPPPATIEVRRPQDHRRIEDEVIEEVEEDVRALPANPIEYLASPAHTHSSAVVRELIGKLIVPLRELEQQHLPKLPMKRTRDVHEQINLLLIAVMEGKIPPHSEQLVTQVQEIVTRYKRIEGVLGIDWGYIPIPNMETYLLQMCEELAKEPIMVPTGQKRMVKRIRKQPVWLTDESEKVITQRSYPEMLKVVSSELANLDNFMARVKYIDANQRRVERTIRTLDPKQDPDTRPLFGQALEDRIVRIQAYNRTPDERGISYCRPRQAVEAEIRQRQERCSQPPEDEPPIYRR